MTATSVVTTVPGVTVLGPISELHSTILTPAALSFLSNLHRAFNPTRLRLLNLRQLRQQEISQGALPNFNKQTRHIREDDAWKGAPPAPGLVDRRVEITGPVDRKMVINALNSGACVFMADFEDSNAPTWGNNLCGQVNLRDAIFRKIDFTNKEGKQYKLREDGKVATLMVRPRGWHLDEAHILVDGDPVAASIFDFGLYFFHCAHQSIRIGSGPYFYLPKLESHLEARLWNDIFNYAQDSLRIPRGTIRATVLIETILAAFEMDEILYELRTHSAGLNCGRWDYIFSFIKKFRNDPRFVLPDRSEVTMRVPFMAAYVSLLIKTCHRRGVHAMGGMAAQIPIKNNPKLNEEAMEKVRLDKEREARAGHDGTWVAHPALVPIAKKVFDQYMPGPNQHYQRRETVKVSAADLLDSHVVGGQITDNGVKDSVHVSLKYVESWLRGIGCVEINYLMEDAATAEIARSQLWQWCRHGSITREGRRINKEWIRKELAEEVHRRLNKTPNGKWKEAGALLERVLVGEDWVDFLTDGLCYPEIIEPTARKSKAKI